MRLRLAVGSALLCCGMGVLLHGERAGGADSATGKPTVPLWPNGAPGARGTSEKDRPNLTVHLPPVAKGSNKANGCAVVICPGGGYEHLAMAHEGNDVAAWFNTFGVAGFVLRYRLGPEYRHPAPMLDVQRAVRLVRANASEWHVDPSRVGVMGFSAGGHLASTAATHFDAGDPQAADPVDRQSCRPDFVILAYPVITLTDKFGHSGSRKNLLGEHPDPKLVESLSNETQVTKATPPTFLYHTSGDMGVPAENSLAFYTALHKLGVPVELHVYEKGKHGLGLGTKDPRYAAVLGTWPQRLYDWMRFGRLLDVK